MTTVIHDGYGSAEGAFSITPSDSTDFTHATRAIRANAAGVVACIFVGSTTAVNLNFAAGETRYLRLKRVNSTNTTATGLEGLY